MTLQVRAAALDDVPAAAEALADAFADYPWTRWTVDADGHGDRLRALHHLYLSAVAVPFGHVDLGEAGQELVGIAVWVPSTGIPDEVWAHVGPAAAEMAGHRAAAAAEAEETLADRRPREPHLTLASLGVVSHRQGQGLGAALLAPGLDRADRDGSPVWLETSAEANVRFYRRLGFAVTDVVDLPRGGPRTWLMLREPGATAADRTATAAAGRRADNAP
ncbi:Acetyltransferase (GNAT) family protein [Geodermatophilus obscurus]|uniref:Acetyltransferase (GNAT) family protein n=1 Tax=Geodermatophilus obscurus TaxID=1861 RepID=A0A1M7TVQ9_9ACTN|nr:GNAT family N-acetyltransferase [Geodermatophilus obscurus]SHN74817.1 Acetyltransferase (GNAT) family protein [Geodermatophilus obscurus]